MQLIDNYGKSPKMRLLASAVVVAGLMGCDSTPPTPTDPSPPMPELELKNKKANNKVATKSIKNLTKPAAAPADKP